MKVGLYSGHLYKDGQVGSGTSKYIYYLVRELATLGVDVVRLEKGDNPTDVDILHDPHAPWNAPLRPKRPLVITIHDLTPLTHPQYYPRWVRTLFVGKLRWFLRRCARGIVDSGRIGQVLASSLRPRVPVDIVHLGVEDRFVVSPQPPPDVPFLVQVGVHRRIKEPMVTLNAFEQIADQIPHGLQFIGTDNVFLEPVKARVAQNPTLQSRVTFDWPGEDAIPRVYNRTSLVVHPCPEEGFGFVPLEALACGAHVLARAPAVRETLGSYGCYFDDPATLGSRILECLMEGPKGTPEDRSQHARQFTFRAMAERTLAAYEAAAAGTN
jgi:glycosyltransferase involved in cell wall biosynthesis